MTMAENKDRLVIDVHPETTSPTRLWPKLRVKQNQTKVEPIDPNTSISDDKVRFVCTSDTHNRIEKLDVKFVPDGDILLHGGDFTNVGLPKDIVEFNDFLGMCCFCFISGGLQMANQNIEIYKNQQPFIYNDKNTGSFFYLQIQEFLS